MLRVLSSLDQDKSPTTLPTIGRNVPTSGYYLNPMEFLAGFHGESLSGKKSKK
jgi:hypothetical protein